MTKPIAATVGLLGVLLLTSCGGTPSGEAVIRSARQGVELDASLSTSVYAPVDENTADIFLSDLPPSYFEPGADWSQASGSIVHLHQFVEPQAGKTPIDRTACSVTMRWIVVSGGAVGVYGGGGFLTTPGKPGDSTYGGKLREGSLRLVAGSPSFDDRLGSGTATITFTARKNPEAAQRIAHAMTMLASQAQRVGE